MQIPLSPSFLAFKIFPKMIVFPQPRHDMTVRQSSSEKSLSEPYFLQLTRVSNPAGTLEQTEVGRYPTKKALAGFIIDSVSEAGWNSALFFLEPRQE